MDADPVSRRSGRKGGSMGNSRLRAIATVVGAIALTVLFALALWYRITSLEAVPLHNGDESYYGLQTARLLRGESFAIRTPTNNLLNPYLVALQLPFQWQGKPAFWVLRAPAVFCGILAVLLMYFLGSKALDRTTGLIATILVASLPVTVFYSRFGLEQCPIPVFGILAIVAALRANGIALLLVFLASLIDHPTNVFLAPIVFPVYLVRVLQSESDPARRRRTLLLAATAGLAISVGAAFFLLKSPIVHHFLRTRPPLNWLKFLDGFERLLFFLYHAVSRSALHLHRWIFRSLLAVLLIFGTVGLVRERRWDRIALILGLLASLVGFHLVAGSTILTTFATHRYGVVFVVPTVLAFACLIRALIPPPASESGVGPRLGWIPNATVLVLGFALLYDFKLNYFDALTVGTPESFWTLQTESKDPFQNVLALIQEDLARRQRDGTPATSGSKTKAGLVVVEEYWAYMPIAYLASSQDQIRVVRLLEGNELILGQMPKRRDELIEQLRAGAYAVENLYALPFLGGGVVGNTVRAAFRPDQVQSWSVLDLSRGCHLTVYRLVDGARATPVPVASAPPRDRDAASGSSLTR
jgi:hypothetical protein